MGYIKLRNYVISRNHKCNPIEIIEQADTYQRRVLYDKGTNLDNLEDIASNKSMNKYNRNRMQHCGPPPFNWLKWNMNVSRIQSKHLYTSVLYVEIILDEFSTLM